MIVGLILFFAATIGGTTQTVRSVWSWYEHEYKWREAEYQRLTELRAGYTLDKFKEALGVPVFSRASANGKWYEESFRGQGYWVQTVRRHGSAEVLYYAVTSCASDFTPTFRLFDSTPITLNRHVLADVQPKENGFAQWADYFFPAATANAHFYEIAYGGNPGNYKTFAWGYDDACLNLRSWSSYLDDNLIAHIGPRGTVYGPPASFDAPLQKFRRTIPVNTYAETAPTVDFSQTAGQFQVGVDRILIRTVTNPYYEFSPQPPPPNEYFGEVDVGMPRRAGPARNTWNCLQSPLILGGSIVMNEEWAVLTKALPSDLSGYAGGGVLVVDGPFEERDLGKQTVTLLFARSQAGQARIEKALRARKLGSIRSVRGVVTLWKRPPTPDEFSVIEGCV